MIHLKNVTMIIIDTLHYGEAISAVNKSLKQVTPAKTKFLTDIKAYNPKFGFEVVPIQKLESKKQYSEFVIKHLDGHFDTDFVLVIQHDGYVLNGSEWSSDFLNYDYIGAPWLESDGYNVGNGGFSLRSKKLQHILATDDFIKPFHPEDNTICRIYRQYLEDEYGIKFAPEEVAEKFSFELRQPVQKTFGFHGKFHEEYKPVMVVRRNAAMGDCIAIEPLLEYYHNNGYRVYLDMPFYFFILYIQHRYPVSHISNLDGRVPYTLVDLDMSYENNPKQLHLQSFYDAAGIKDGEIRNPLLDFNVDDNNRLFNNYVVLHIDYREQASRNIYGIKWDEVVSFFNKKGYLVIQIGQRERENVSGAVYLNTPVNNMVLWLMKGASYFVGVDSGPSNIAVASGIPSVIFFGSVNPDYIIPDQSKCLIVHLHKSNVCDKPFCWHETPGSISGTECYIDDKNPPCTRFSHEDFMYQIDKFVK